MLNSTNDSTAIAVSDVKRQKQVQSSPLNTPTQKKVIAFALDALFSPEPLSLYPGAQTLLENLHSSNYEIIILSPASTSWELGFIYAELVMAGLAEKISEANIIADLRIIEQDKRKKLASILALVKDHCLHEKYRSEDYLIVTKNGYFSRIDGYDRVSLVTTEMPFFTSPTDLTPAPRSYKELEERLCRPQAFNARKAGEITRGKVLTGITVGFGVLGCGTVPSGLIVTVLSVLASTACPILGLTLVGVGCLAIIAWALMLVSKPEPSATFKTSMRR
jgi:hypothetical protein